MILAQMIEEGEYTYPGPDSVALMVESHIGRDLVEEFHRLDVSRSRIPPEPPTVAGKIYN